MKVTTHLRGNTAILELTGRFDFSAHSEFRGAIKNALETAVVRQVDVRMRAVDYMDSSALGMLLLSRENAHAIGKTIVLSHVSDVARQTLDVVNFHKLFDIQSSARLT